MGDNKIFTGLGEAGKQKGKKPKSEITRIVLVVGIIVLLAWNIFFVDWDKPGVTEAIPAPDVVTRDIPVATGDPVSQRESAPRSIAPPDSGDAADGGNARAVIAQARNTGTPPNKTELYAKAKAHVQAGKMADAYLLHFYLVKEGHGPSAMALAEMADPNHHNPETSFYEGPDFTQAHKWYVQALMLGEEKADRRLAELKLRVKAAVAAGDEKARRLLVGW